MTTFVWQLRITQTTVATACLAVAALFGSGYGVGVLAQRNAVQVELIAANEQRAAAWQIASQAHQQKGAMMGRLMEHFRTGSQPFSDAPDLAANEAAQTDHP